MSDQMKHLQSDQVRQRTQRRPWWATEKHCLPANTDKFLSYGKHSTHGILSLQHKKKKKLSFYCSPAPDMSQLLEVLKPR
ncbi:Uncharacterized protein APZ42_019555 [Daphnia magna]|uniref:Uncharacterized protein n=1 Tax=Daphnia magna TaxID=35525 RepID=A0A164Y8X6_9CRUS|nr:Uncharacterized protein APZ42_019555 [Daphnia magna]